MAINTSKSKTTLVCTPEKRVRLLFDIFLNVSFGGVALDNVSDIKILGFIIDKKLTWKPHIKYSVPVLTVT